MALRGEIYLIGGSVMKRETRLLNTPCIECKLKDICSPIGVVNPTACPYLIAW